MNVLQYHVSKFPGGPAFVLERIRCIRLFLLVCQLATEGPAGARRRSIARRSSGVPCIDNALLGLAGGHRNSVSRASVHRASVASALSGGSDGQRTAIENVLKAAAHEEELRKLRVDADGLRQQVSLLSLPLRRYLF